MRKTPTHEAIDKYEAQLDEWRALQDDLPEFREDIRDLEKHLNRLKNDSTYEPPRPRYPGPIELPRQQRGLDE